MAKTYLANSRAAFLLAAQALDASLRVNPYFRRADLPCQHRPRSARFGDGAGDVAPPDGGRSDEPHGIKIMAYAQQQNARSTPRLLLQTERLALDRDVAVTQFDSTDTAGT